MVVYHSNITIKSKGTRPTFIDITDQVKDAINKSNVDSGICAVVSPHTTCSVIFEEYAHDENEFGEDTLQVELLKKLDQIIPRHTARETYVYPGAEHLEEVRKWPDADDWLPSDEESILWNGDAHLRSSILGSSEVFSVNNNLLDVGKTGYVYFVDFDCTRERERNCRIIVLGE